MLRGVTAVFSPVVYIGEGAAGCFGYVRAAAPFIARMVETSLAEVDAGVVEAAQSMGASTCQIIRQVVFYM